MVPGQECLTFLPVEDWKGTRRYLLHMESFSSVGLPSLGVIGNNQSMRTKGVKFIDRVSHDPWVQIITYWTSFGKTDQLYLG